MDAIAPGRQRWLKRQNRGRWQPLIRQLWRWMDWQPRWWQRRSRGQAYVEFLLVLPLLLLLIAGVTAFGQAFYVKLATQAAAWSATRHAVATLNASRGISQAHLATRHTLSGFGLNPNTAQVQVYAGSWGRATDVQVQVCYPVPRPPVPLGDLLAPTHVCSRQLMPTQRWKSRW